MSDNHISRDGLQFIAQEIELIRSRLNRIEDRIKEEVLTRQKEDLENDT